MPDTNPPDTDATATMTERDIGADREKARHERADAQPDIAQTMADVARQAMDQGQEAVRFCFNTFSAANGPAAESTLARGRQAMADGTTVLEAYRHAVDRSMNDLQAMMNAYANLGRGMLNCQRTYADAVRQTFDRMGEKPRQLVGCTSPAEAARLQRELCFDLTGGVIAGNVAALQALSQAAQEALRPLQERSRPA